MAESEARVNLRAVFFVAALLPHDASLAAVESLLRNTGLGPEPVVLRGKPPDLWQPVSEGDDAERFFVNPRRLGTSEQGLLTFWVMSVPAEPKQVSQTTPDFGKYMRAMFHVEAACAPSTRSRILRSVFYDEDGRLTASDSVPTPFHAAVPDTVGEAYVRAACELSARYGRP